MLVTLGLKLVAWHFLSYGVPPKNLRSLVLDTCRLKLSKYRRLRLPYWFGILGPWIMALAPAAAVFKEIHYLRPGPGARSGRRTRFPSANDLIRIFPQEFFLVFTITNI